MGVCVCLFLSVSFMTFVDERDDWSLSLSGDVIMACRTMASWSLQSFYKLYIPKEVDNKRSGRHPLPPWRPSYSQQHGTRTHSDGA